MKKYTVVGCYDFGDVFVDCVKADSPGDAERKVLDDRVQDGGEDVYVYAVFEGYRKDVREEQP